MYSGGTPKLPTRIPFKTELYVFEPAYNLLMDGALSSERFASLFNTEKYQDFSPIENDVVSRQAKKCFIGVQPLEFDLARATLFLFEAEDISPWNYYAVLPAVLFALARTEPFYDLYPYFNRIESLQYDLNPNDLDLPYVLEILGSLKFQVQHIDFMLLMLKELNRKIALIQEQVDGHPVGIETVIEYFELIRDAMAAKSHSAKKASK